MFTIYVYVLDTLADWELGYVTSELNSGRFFKKGAQRVSLKTVSASRETVTTMGGLTIVPDCLIDEMVAEKTSMLILPGANTWSDPRHGAVIEKAREFLSAGAAVCAICGATTALPAAGSWISVRTPAMGRDFLNCFPPVIKGSAFTSISRRWRTTI